MASTKEYLDFILEQLSELDEITYRAMMGEYIIYYRGKVVGGIYDDRFLVKPTKSALEMMPNAQKELPYEGAKEMLLVDDIDNRSFLKELIEANIPLCVPCLKALMYIFKEVPDLKVVWSTDWRLYDKPDYNGFKNPRQWLEK